MGTSTSIPESIAIRLIADKPVRKTPYQVKGVFMKQFPEQKIVPFLDGKLRNKYLYPRVQVKILNEQIYIVGIKEGVEPVMALIDNINSFNFGNITINIDKYEIEKNIHQFKVTEKLYRYKFITPWIALNKSTGGKYRFLSDQEKFLYLNKLLGQNLLFISNEVGDEIKTKIYVKVIIETCLLTDDEKKLASEIAMDAGAHFIKTSTGFSLSGATEKDVKLIRKIIGSDMKIKASGGIKNLSDLKKLVKAGADRIGTSNAISIINE